MGVLEGHQMNRWIDKLTDVTAIANDEAFLKEALAALSIELGFDGYAFFHDGPGNTYAVSNYDERWLSIYFDNNYKAIDPVVRRARLVGRAFTWSWEKFKSYLTAQQKDLYAVSADFGIRSGVTIPIRGPNGSISMFTLASGKADIGTNEDIDAVAAAAAVGQLHARIAQLRTQPTCHEAALLTPKEARYLRWIEAGKTVDEIAEIEGVKYNTVRINLENAKRRFGVYNITQLTAIAIRRQLI